MKQFTQQDLYMLNDAEMILRVFAKRGQTSWTAEQGAHLRGLINRIACTVSSAPFFDTCDQALLPPTDSEAPA